MNDNKKKSVSVNAILNVIKTCLSIIFPLITFPYISRVLQTDNIGKINFASSINSYFLLLAGLGISTYAIREGARIRNNKKELTDFASQIFSINIISTIGAYAILLIVLKFSPQLNDYKYLILIYSIQIIFTTFGVEWIYSIYEDYLYITIRAFLVQIISLVLMFMFVRYKQDYTTYVLLCVFASSAMYVFNFVHSRRYCRIRFTLEIDWAKNLLPIMVLFANSISILIYVASDITILGLICGDHQVGLYSVSVKVYSIVKQAINAIVVVSIPRVSYYLAQGDEEHYYDLLNRIFKGIISMCLPAIIILFVLAPNIIEILSGNSYLGATSSLRILCIAIIFSLVASFLVSVVLIPKRKEKIVLFATVCGALLNIGLNLVLIPQWKQDAAAFTTLIAEAGTVTICFLALKEEVKRFSLSRTFLNSIVSCIVMCVCIFVLNYVSTTLISFLRVIIIAPICFSSYIICMLLLKDETFWSILNKAKNKLKKVEQQNINLSI